MNRFKTTPMDHQLAELRVSAGLEARAVFWEMGTGKSKLIIDTAAELCRAGEIDGLLVVAPNSVHTNWITDEIPAHLPDDVSERVHLACYQARRASTQWHRRLVDRAIRHRDGLSIMAMSYDALMTSKGRIAAWEFLKQRRNLYVLDESARIKTPGAKCTIRTVRSGVYAPYRRILTGTPVTNSPFDVYAPLRFLQNDFWQLHDLATFGAFQHEFGIIRRMPGQGGWFDDVVGYRRLDKLQEWLAPISTRVLKADVMDLPPKTYSRRVYQMSPAQTRLYRELRDEYMTEFAGKTITAAIVLTRLLRLQQVTCGYLPVDDDEPERLIDENNPRLRLLEDVVADVPHQAIIWARFRRDIDLIMELLGDRAVRFDGKCNDDERTVAKKRFKTGEVQFFVSNPAVGGEGLTLTEAKTVIYYNNNFKLRERLQSEDRAHRRGQDCRVQYIDLQAADTVDQHITASLLKKWNLATQVTGDVGREWLQ